MLEVDSVSLCAAPFACFAIFAWMFLLGNLFVAWWAVLANSFAASKIYWGHSDAYFATCLNLCWFHVHFCDRLCLDYIWHMCVCVWVLRIVVHSCLTHLFLVHIFCFFCDFESPRIGRCSAIVSELWLFSKCLFSNMCWARHKINFILWTPLFEPNCTRLVCGGTDMQRPPWPGQADVPTLRRPTVRQIHLIVG